VKALLYAGCKVISGGRSIEAATKSFQEANIINSSINNNNNNNNNLNKNLIIYELDLESLSLIIKAFADKCLTESCGRVDYLILNAGIMDIYLFLR
jgi:NAD(P)-dependent dehydrogenase (short-subunit alcohol dehydrogenase family)